MEFVCPSPFSITARLIYCFSIVAFATPPLFGAIRGGSYFIIAGFVFISFMLVIFVYRETAHKTLEELSEVFEDKEYIVVFIQLYACTVCTRQFWISVTKVPPS
jgi:hypothetical protein